MRGSGCAHVRDAGVGLSDFQGEGRRRHPPPSNDKLAPFRAIAHDRGGRVGAILVLALNLVVVGFSRRAGFLAYPAWRVRAEAQAGELLRGREAPQGLKAAPRPAPLRRGRPGLQAARLLVPSPRSPAADGVFAHAPSRSEERRRGRRDRGGCCPLPWRHGAAVLGSHREGGPSLMLSQERAPSRSSRPGGMSS